MFGLRTCETGYDYATRRRPDDSERLPRLRLSAIECIDQLGLVDVPVFLYILCTCTGQCSDLVETHVHLRAEGPSPA